MALSSFCLAVRGAVLGSSGAARLRTDLSTSREGDAARLAAREWIELEAVEVPWLADRHARKLL